MYISFSKTLMRWGGIRIGIGTRKKGAEGLFFLFLFGMMQLFWWALVGAFWFMYGVGYVFIYLPIKGVKKLLKKEE